MYDGVVTYEDEHEFDVPKDRLKMMLVCYNTQCLGVVQTKGMLYSSLNYNNLLHVSKRDRLLQNSNNIDRNSCGIIACLMILKESTPAKGELIMQLKLEDYRKGFCHELNVLLSKYRDNFFFTNDFDKHKYFSHFETFTLFKKLMYMINVTFVKTIS